MWPRASYYYVPTAYLLLGSILGVCIQSQSYGTTQGRSISVELRPDSPESKLPESRLESRQSSVCVSMASYGSYESSVGLCCCKVGAESLASSRHLCCMYYVLGPSSARPRLLTYLLLHPYEIPPTAFSVHNAPHLQPHTPPASAKAGCTSIDNAGRLISTRCCSSSRSSRVSYAFSHRRTPSLSVAASRRSKTMQSM